MNNYHLNSLVCLSLFTTDLPLCDFARLELATACVVLLLTTGLRLFMDHLIVVDLLVLYTKV